MSKKYFTGEYTAEKYEIPNKIYIETPIGFYYSKLKKVNGFFLEDALLKICEIKGVPPESCLVYGEDDDRYFILNPSSLQMRKIVQYSKSQMSESMFKEIVERLLSPEVTPIKVQIQNGDTFVVDNESYSPNNLDVTFFNSKFDFIKKEHLVIAMKIAAVIAIWVAVAYGSNILSKKAKEYLSKINTQKQMLLKQKKKIKDAIVKKRIHLKKIKDAKVNIAQEKDLLVPFRVKELKEKIESL